jgi:cellulose synthase/poly-beta-1,6-N-acetylglucosamine synthase-like glycosyltransferase
MKLALSFVIPMYNAASTIAQVVRDIEQLDVPGGHEIVLVDDCGGDNTIDVCRKLVDNARVPITLVSIVRDTMPFVVSMIVVLGLITFIPELVLWIPRASGYQG